MSIVDISGPIYDGMWNFPEPMGSLLGAFHLSEIEFEHCEESYTIDVFENMKAQTGTYIESPGRYLEGNRYSVEDITVEELYMREAYMLSVPYEKMGEKDGKRFLSLDDIREAEKGKIPPDAAILVGTGYGRNWERRDFFERSWFFKREAMEYLIEKRPFLLGTDSAEWENPRDPEGIFKIFFPANIFILSPCINLEKVSSYRVKLTVMPLKVRDAFICPVRAVVVEP